MNLSRTRFSTIIAAFVLTTLAIFLPNPDFENYRDIYYGTLDGEHVSYSVEPFFFFLCKIALLSGIEFTLFYSVFVFISVALKLRFLQIISPNLFVSIFIYVTAIYLLFDVIAIRQGMAISFVLWGSYFLFANRFMLAFVSSFVAMSMHFSAIIFMPFAILAYFLNGKRALVQVLVAVFLIFFVHVTSELFDVNAIAPEFAIQKIAIYAQEGPVESFSIRALILFLISLHVLMYKKVGYKYFFLSAAVLSGIYIENLLDVYPQVSYRAKWYFFAFSPLLVAQWYDICRRSSAMLSIFAVIYVASYGISFAQLYESLNLR